MRVVCSLLGKRSLPQFLVIVQPKETGQNEAQRCEANRPSKRKEVVEDRNSFGEDEREDC